MDEPPVTGIYLQRHTLGEGRGRGYKITAGSGNELFATCDKLARARDSQLLLLYQSQGPLSQGQQNTRE